MAFNTSKQHLQGSFSNDSTNGTFNRLSKFMQILRLSSDSIPFENYFPPPQVNLEDSIEDISPPLICSLCQTKISETQTHPLLTAHGIIMESAYRLP